MAFTQNNNYNFPYFPPLPPHNYPSPPKMPPSNNPPAPAKLAPPPHHSLSPPPPARPPSHLTPPPPPTVKPPPHPIYPPPPPHIVPTPPPPGHHSTVIIIVFVSLGGLFFLAFLSVALCCLIKKRKNKMVQETDTVKIDEHVKVQEAIIPGPHGPLTVILSVEDDVHILEEIKKNETLGRDERQSAQDHPQVQDIEASTSSTAHHHLGHKTG